ncbi:penicillin-binding protein 1A [Halovulum dunhuangense]|uniref:Penicillin-binding protein 1A n=1 Tax=Halovulum dunhuangense TaxID=1505036 RepID=A0A849L2S2_9RHOB|nr:penicillin-binding protein 1A [Halovulum dunhuangense]NNU80658.1 penicillin-binding protein 1A [Halovulum dunhuangense]
MRLILNFLGFIFTWATLGLFMAAAGLAGLFWLYGRDLPDHEQLSRYEPATLSRIYSGRGLLMDEFARERRLFTPIEEIPDLVKVAFISAEDKNFYNHPGFDIMGIASAVVDAAQGGRLRGASTITQQVMKNFLLSGERSAVRKIKEIILATRLEATLSKDQILELYLNDIFLGQNSYGVTSAARTYFSKSLEELTAAEVAYLAALPRAPSNYHPVREKEEAIGRRNYVLGQMLENGYIDRDTYETARASDLLTVQSGDIPSARDALPPRDYFTDEIRRQLSTRLEGGEEELFTGGLTVRATVDPKLQAAAAEALRRGLERFDRSRGTYFGPLAQISPDALDSEEEWRVALAETRVPRDVVGWIPAVVLEVGESSARIGIEGVENDEDGHFLALSDADWITRIRAGEGREGGRPGAASDLYQVGDVVLVTAIVEDGAFQRWSLRQIPEIQGAFMAMDTQTGRVLAMQGGFSYQHSVFNRATQATRQPGSAFKPFVYAAALDNGYTPASIVVDAPVEVDTGAGVWRPTNSSNRFYGPTPVRTGIEQSRNLMTVRIAQDIGMDRVSTYAERFGIYEDMPELLSYSLGAGETTLFNMVAAYAMFGNGGKRLEPTLVDRVQDRYGNTIYQHDQRGCRGCEGQEATPADMPWIWDTAEQVMDPVTAYQLSSMMQGVVARGTAASTVGTLGVPIAGKTGTTNDAKDAWFVGYTPRITAGCYIGYDTPRPMGDGAYGGTLCGPVFTDFMRVALEDHGSFRIPQPPDTVFVKIDRFTGQRLPDDASGSNVVAELFRAGEQPAIGQFGTYIDGGFAMGADLPLFSSAQGGASMQTGQDGQQRVVPTNPSFGELSSGGLY